MTKIFYFLLLVVCLFFLFGMPVVAGQGVKAQYGEALRYIREKQYDFAFLEFRAILKEFPKSRYAKESMFAIGEYFYTQKMYCDAIKNFAEYIKKYPDSDAAIFARAYLLKTMEIIEKPAEEEKEAIENIKMEFFSKPLFLLFSEYKEVSYKSAFQNIFIIRYYVDMIEVYRNDELFIKIVQ